MPRVVSRVLVPKVMFELSFDLEILVQGSACSHVHDLDSAADAEDRFLDLIHEVFCHCDIVVITLWDDGSAIALRRCVILLRSYIMSTGDDHTI